MDDATRQNKSDRLVKLEQQRAKLQRKIAREETRLKTQERKIDTRRKIIAGAIVLTHADMREAFKDILHELLQKFVEPKDKHLFADVFTPEEIAQASIEAKKRRDEAFQDRQQNLNARTKQQSQGNTPEAIATDQDNTAVMDHDDQAGQLPDTSTSEDAQPVMATAPKPSALEALKVRPAPQRKKRTAGNLGQLKKPATTSARQKRQTAPKINGSETFH